MQKELLLASRRDPKPGESIEPGLVWKDNGAYFCTVRVIYETGSFSQVFIWNKSQGKAIEFGNRVQLPREYNHLWYRAQDKASGAIREYMQAE